MKKGQIQGQIVIYVLSSVVVILILMYGYKAIESFKEKSDTVDYIQFKKDFDKTVQSIAGDFGSELTETFHLPFRSDEVCFVASVKVEGSGGSVQGNNIGYVDSPTPSHGSSDYYHPIMSDSVSSGEGLNVFLFKKKDGYSELIGAPFKVDNLIVGAIPPDIEHGHVYDALCFPATGYAVKIKFIGEGSGTRIAPALP